MRVKVSTWYVTIRWGQQKRGRTDYYTKVESITAGDARNSIMIPSGYFIKSISRFPPKGLRAPNQNRTGTSSLRKRRSPIKPKGRSERT